MRKQHKKKRYQMTPQAAAIMLAGIFMAAFPFIILHSGYTGGVIFADDSLREPFDKSVIYIDEDGIGGSVGVILNKPLTEEQRSHLTAFMRNSGIPVGYGGPVGLYDRIIVLEEKKLATKDGQSHIELSDWDDAVREKPDLLNRIRQSMRDGDQQYRVFTGITSWSPFQLESEILVKNDWYAIPATHDLIFQNEGVRWETLEHQEKAKKGPKPDQS